VAFVDLALDGHILEVSESEAVINEGMLFVNGVEHMEGDIECGSIGN